MKPFAQQIGPVVLGFAAVGLPTVTVHGKVPQADRADHLGDSSTARALISRPEAMEIRDWLTDFLGDGDA